jgi:glycosyltransferase involved in cell wall biosynthesis
VAPRSLKVGLLIDRFEPERGGAERALLALAEHLTARGHRPVAFARRSTAKAALEFQPVRARGLTRAGRERSLAGALPRAARSAGCDVTVGVRHLEQVDLYWPHDGAYAASLAAKRTRERRPVALDAEQGRQRVFLDLERGLLEGGAARRVVCVSELVERELAELYPACRGRLVRCDNGVDLERFHPRRRQEAGQALRERLRLGAGTPLVVFAGRDAERKGLQPLLRALWRCRSSPWFFVAAGLRHRLTWMRRIEFFGLDRRRIKLLPPCDSSALLAAADLCVLPTWRDTCGLVVLEALASGTPVLTTAQAGAAPVIEREVAGEVLASAADEDGLAQALARWLARASAAPPDRARVRSCVEGRARGPWLDRLCQEVEALAETRAAAIGS